MVVSQGEITLNLIALYKAIGGGWEAIEREEHSTATAR